MIQVPGRSRGFHIHGSPGHPIRIIFSGVYLLYHNLKLHVLQPDLHLLHPHPELHLPHPQPELHPQLPVDAAEAVRPAAWAAVLATGDWLHWLLA